MSNYQAVVGVADQLMTRLFDQRQFTTGEINYLANELGERTNLEENFDKVLRLNQSVCVIADTSNTTLTNLRTDVAANILQKVSEITDSTERLLRIEEEHKCKEDQLMSQVRAERANVRENCERKMEKRLEKLNKSLEKEELELEKKYLKFEQNLRKL